MTRLDITQIKGLKPKGKYRVSVGLLGFSRQIYSWVKEDGLNLRPDFQRPLRWTTNQQVAFVEFILRGGTCSELLFNDPAWLDANIEPDFVCVDGLQRITALLKFFDDDLPVFDRYYYSEIDNLRKTYSATSIMVRINSLQTRREVIEWYLELNEGGTPHSEEDLEYARRKLSEASRPLNF